MYNEKLFELPNLRQRVSFLELLSTNLNYFGNISDSKLKAVAQIKNDTYYEEVTEVGYHPDLRLMTASIQIKRPVGYLGGLCTHGSNEYVRFYIDYGHGWEDQGYTGVTVHDIPESTGCQKDTTTPLIYVVNLKLNPRFNFCTHPSLPKLRAVLSWNSIPPANTPNFHPVWGNHHDHNIQIKPLYLRTIEPLKIPELSNVLTQAILNPTIPLSHFLSSDPIAKTQSSQIAASLNPREWSLSDQLTSYKKEVAPARFGLTAIKNIQGLTNIELALIKIDDLKSQGFPWIDAVKELEKLKGSTHFEELLTVGLGPLENRLEATLVVKQKLGYAGDLCTAGGKEYVSFWADWNNDCNWTYLGLTTVNVHDIPSNPAEGLTYTTILPYDFSAVAVDCRKPQTPKIRAILSYGIPPSQTDPHATNHYGNAIESYIQMPLRQTDSNTGLTVIALGRITIDDIDTGTGLTTAGAKIGGIYPVSAGAPFAGDVWIQGYVPEGQQYRFRVTNLNTGEFSFINTPLTVDGFSGSGITHTPVLLDSTTNYYTAINTLSNMESILAIWKTGTNDRWLIEMQDSSATVVFSRKIQLHNAYPDATLNVNDAGDCRHFHKGDPVTGNYSVSDDDPHTGLSYVDSFTLGSTIGSFTVPHAGASINGSTDISGQTFSVDTNQSTSPCGKVYLTIHAKTILNSTDDNVYKSVESIICLQP